MGQSLGVTLPCQALREGEPLPKPHAVLTEVSMGESHPHVDIWAQCCHVSPLLMQSSAPQAQLGDGWLSPGHRQSSPCSASPPAPYSLAHSPGTPLPQPAAAEIPPGWMEPFQEETMLLIGDKRLFPADRVLGAMGKGCTAQSQAIWEGGGKRLRPFVADGKGLMVPQHATGSTEGQAQSST